MPSNVQLVSISILTRSSLPAARNCSSLRLDLAQRHAAVHGVLVERIGVQVGDVRPGQHQPVVVRLVAVAVDQHDVAGLDQRLSDDLVRGRGAVGDEEGLPRAERLRGQFLRVPQRTGRLQQRIQTTAGCRRLGQEDVQPVEVRPCR